MAVKRIGISTVQIKVSMTAAHRSMPNISFVASFTNQSKAPRQCLTNKCPLVRFYFGSVTNPLLTDPAVATPNITRAVLQDFSP
jgi:hypothetical protein